MSYKLSGNETYETYTLNYKNSNISDKTKVKFQFSSIVNNKILPPFAFGEITLGKDFKIESTSTSGAKMPSNNEIFDVSIEWEGKKESIRLTSKRVGRY
ncbi:hypothetical protein [Thermincola ferriacetica]|uniref:hypothetical protein n=1 Tax=Thermincola ferriacetica TaxID=281456 RepID=UPI00128DAD94|nr:hypothetical protein [Thermincola ferriacetica]